MDETLDQEETPEQQGGGLPVPLKLVHGIFNWLAGLIEPTDEDQEKAGVYLGGEGRD